MLIYVAGLKKYGCKQAIVKERDTGRWRLSCYIWYSPPINGQCTSFISLDVAPQLPLHSKGLQHVLHLDTAINPCNKRDFYELRSWDARPSGQTDRRTDRRTQRTNEVRTLMWRSGTNTNILIGHLFRFTGALTEPTAAARAAVVQLYSALNYVSSAHKTVMLCTSRRSTLWTEL